MITTLSIIILAVMAIAMIWQLAIGLRPMWTAGASPEEDQDVSPSESPATLTVVLIASCEEDVLDEWIAAILQQDYPAFDVVVVYDSNAEATAALSERYAGEKRLYFTFIPQGSHTLNRRKLALTLGIKAAKGEYVLTTVPNVEIPSASWLSRMMEPVNNRESGTEVVLGYSHFDFPELSPCLRRRARIVSTTRDSRWIGDALRGNPWRGDGNNLVFRRQLFFDNKGFADGLLLEGGDDDIFVGRIANGENTAVRIGPETILTLKWGKGADLTWSAARRRYRSTLPLMPSGPRTTRQTCRLISWLMPVAAAGALLAGGCSWLAGAIAGLLLILFYSAELTAYRRASRRLGL